MHPGHASLPRVDPTWLRLKPTAIESGRATSVFDEAIDNVAVLTVNRTVCKFRGNHALVVVPLTP